MTPEDKKWIKHIKDIISEPDTGYRYKKDLTKAVSIIDAQEREIKDLLSWLKIAASRIKEWGDYALKFYQEKWNLKGDIKQILDVVRSYDS